MKKIPLKVLVTFEIILLISVFFTIIICGGCGKKKITEGEVYSKGYQPETTTMMPIPNTIMVGKTSITTYTYVPITNDEYWFVNIRNKEEGDKKYRTRKLYVSESFCQRVKNSDWIVIIENGISIVENK